MPVSIDELTEGDEVCLILHMLGAEVRGTYGGLVMGRVEETGESRWFFRIEIEGYPIGLVNTQMIETIYSLSELEGWDEEDAEGEEWKHGG